ncbi:hypothetical protein GE09DRAFT_1054083 [Coniochaeta sp. 2T2.1]|nr:hypothetical protein GE09DRAFT_1054083 [Coniochaeta sp. 2T2.1]
MIPRGYLLAVASCLAVPFIASAQVTLGTASTFGVLGSAAITNTGPTDITGDIGVSDSGTITGFPPGTFTGIQHLNDATAIQANIDATAAYTTAAGLPSDVDLSGQDLSGLTLGPGVYSFDTSAALGGPIPLVLDAAGDANSQFVFQIGSTLTLASAASIQLAGLARSCNVIWQVDSSATLGTSSVWAGSILALSSVTAQTGAQGAGSLIALTGAVTLDSNEVAADPVCAAVVTSTVSGTTSTISTLTQSSTDTITTTDITTTTDIVTTSTIVTVTVTATGTVTVTGSATVTSTDFASVTVTLTESLTNTETSVTSVTQTNSATVTNTGTTVTTQTDSATVTNTETASSTQTGSVTVTNTDTAFITQTNVATATETQTASETLQSTVTLLGNNDHRHYQPLYHDIAIIVNKQLLQLHHLLNLHHFLFSI